MNGNGHTISATNPATGTYTGAVLTNASGAHTMNIENLTVTGAPAGFFFPVPGTCQSPFPGLFGIFFNDASGSVTKVNVLNIFETVTPFPACIVGHGIRADAATPQTVKITDTNVSQFQRGGLFASGEVTMNVSGGTIGPGSSVPFSIAQNAVQWANVSTVSSPPVGASGTMTGTTIVGSSFVHSRPVDPASAASTAVLLFGARNVTVDHNTIEGGSDLGISVEGASTNSVISFNADNRPSPPTPDSFGIGVSVTADSAAETALHCNTFSGWKANIHGDEQISCTLPIGSCTSAYSAHLTVEGGTAPFTWSSTGTLPPGLSLASTGAITGTTPDKAGTFPFVAHVEDSSSPHLIASQDESITIAGASCALPPEEQGENPALPESSEPGEAPAATTAPITQTTVPVTG